MQRIVRPVLSSLLVAVTLAATLLALASWANAPLPQKSMHLTRTAAFILKAPFADAIIIGDSRVQGAEPTHRALLAGYNGATFPELERIAGLLCRLSDAPVVIALGVNDARVERRDIAASLASAERTVQACTADGVAVSAIWPTDPDTEPFGDYYDLDAFAAMDLGLAAIASEHGVPVIPHPEISGHTHDGVHFTPEVSRLYIDTLADGVALVKPRR